MHSIYNSGHLNPIKLSDYIAYKGDASVTEENHRFNDWVMAINKALVMSGFYSTYIVPNGVYETPAMVDNIKAMYKDAGWHIKHIDCHLVIDCPKD